jgi:hypothetical protein
MQHPAKRARPVYELPKDMSNSGYLQVGSQHRAVAMLPARLSEHARSPTPGSHRTCALNRLYAAAGSTARYLELIAVLAASLRLLLSSTLERTRAFRASFCVAN